MPTVIWSGDIDAVTYRVVDQGAGVPRRLTVEMQGTPDAMGVLRWQTLDPMPVAVFEGILESAGVIT